MNPLRFTVDLLVDKDVCLQSVCLGYILYNDRKIMQSFRSSQRKFAVKLDKD